MQNPAPGPFVPPPPPPPPIPFPAVAAAAPAPAGPPPPDYHGMAIALIAGNKDAMGSGKIRGRGFLDLRGTTGGQLDRVERFLEAAHDAGGLFPYWTLDQAQLGNILAGLPVLAQPGPGNPFVAQTPRGNVPFVIMMDGTCRIGPSLRIGMAVTTNHCYISQMAVQVPFAGEMKFGGVMADEGGMGVAGVLISWTNDSGGYRCSGNDAYRVGLPMNRYRGTPCAAPKDRIDYYAGGRGGKINWGAGGAPASVRPTLERYWTH